MGEGICANPCAATVRSVDVLMKFSSRTCTAGAYCDALVLNATGEECCSPLNTIPDCGALLFNALVASTIFPKTCPACAGGGVNFPRKYGFSTPKSFPVYPRKA